MNSVMRDWQVHFKNFSCYMKMASCMSVGNQEFDAEWLLGGNVLCNVTWRAVVS